RNAALATLRIFWPLSAHAGGIAGPASSATRNKRESPSANSVLDSSRISFRAPRLPRLYVGSGRSGAGSLHVAGRPAGNSGAGLDSVAARALLEIDCGSGSDCIYRGPVQQSALWIHSRRQSGLSRL